MENLDNIQAQLDAFRSEPGADTARIDELQAQLDTLKARANAEEAQSTTSDIVPLPTTDPTPAPVTDPTVPTDQPAATVAPTRNFNPRRLDLVKQGPGVYTCSLDAPDVKAGQAVVPVLLATDNAATNLTGVSVTDVHDGVVHLMVTTNGIDPNGEVHADVVPQ